MHGGLHAAQVERFFDDEFQRRDDDGQIFGLATRHDGVRGDAPHGGDLIQRRDGRHRLIGGSASCPRACARCALLWA